MLLFEEATSVAATPTGATSTPAAPISGFFSSLDFNAMLPYAYIALGVMAIIILILLVLLIVTMVSLKKMKRNYRVFMNGKTAESLEDSILDRFEAIDELESLTKLHTSQIDSIKNEMMSVYKKVGIVKYDAFNEMGGKLSFALCMLDKSNNGYVINAIHSREGCYTYIKEIIKGESFITLAEEEKNALEMALEKED